MEPHRECEVMTSDVYVEDAKAWTRTLEDYEARYAGLTVVAARKRVARQIGVSVGTLENLRNRSPKAVAAHIYARLKAGVIRKLEKELTRVEHELQIARQSGSHPADGEVQAVLASRSRLCEALGLNDVSA